MKCGDLGHRSANGEPCGQQISATSKGCLWHDPTRTPEERHFYATKGGYSRKEKKLLPAPPDAPPFRTPDFGTRESVVNFVQDLARRVLTEAIDPRRVEAALRAAGVALTAFGQQTQERMVEALMRLEHGSTAVIMLERLTEGMASGRRRPLPGLPRTLPMPGGDGS